MTKKSNAPSKVSTAWHMPNVLKKIDIFGEPLPGFNVKGETAIPTLTGGICTFLIIIIFISYGSLKFIHLMEKRNPQVIQVTERGVFGSDDIIDLDDIGFKFAFTIENYASNERRDDPAFVKYIVKQPYFRDGVWNENHLTYHECNETDWKDFAPPGKTFKNKFESIRDDPKRGWYCIEMPEESLIYGS